MHKLKNLFFLLSVVALLSTVTLAQKKKAPVKTSQTVSSSGVVKTIKSGKDLIKIVKLDPVTKSAVVTGVTLDWEKNGQVYFDVNLKRGQHLTITPDSKDTSIELYIDFSPLDATASGAYEQDVTKTAGYQIVARTKKIGEKYTLTLKVK
jgi:hypothetical protein